MVLLRPALLLDTKQIGHLFQMLTDAFPVHIDFQKVVISAVRQGRAHGIEIGIVAQYQNRADKAALFQFMNERKPSMPGIFKSVITASMCCVSTMCSASCPLLAVAASRNPFLPHSTADWKATLISAHHLQAINYTLCYLNEWLHLEYGEYIVCRCRGHFQS